MTIKCRMMRTTITTASVAGCLFLLTRMMLSGSNEWEGVANRRLSKTEEVDSLYSDFENWLLSLLPFVTGIPSVVGASLVLWVLWREKRLLFESPHERLILGLSICDWGATFIPFLVFGGPWTLPEEAAPWVLGAEASSHASCTVAGFVFLWQTMGGCLYAVSLLVTQVLEGVWEVSDEIITRRLEPWMHALALLFPLEFALVAALRGWINPTPRLPGICYISEFPPDCHLEAPEFPNRTTIIPATNEIIFDDGLDCRGNPDGFVLLSRIVGGIIVATMIFPALVFMLALVQRYRLGKKLRVIREEQAEAIQRSQSRNNSSSAARRGSYNSAVDVSSTAAARRGSLQSATRRGSMNTLANNSRGPPAEDEILAVRRIILGRAICYSLALMAFSIPSTLLVWFGADEASGSRGQFFFAAFLWVIFAPLRGFFNAITFLSPRLRELTLPGGSLHFLNPFLKKAFGRTEVSTLPRTVQSFTTTLPRRASGGGRGNGGGGNGGNGGGASAVTASTAAASDETRRPPTNNNHDSKKYHSSTVLLRTAAAATKLPADYTAEKVKATTRKTAGLGQDSKDQPSSSQQIHRDSAREALAKDNVHNDLQVASIKSQQHPNDVGILSSSSSDTTTSGGTDHHESLPQRPPPVVAWTEKSNGVTMPVGAAVVAEAVAATKKSDPSGIRLSSVRQMRPPREEWMDEESHDEDDVVLQHIKNNGKSLKDRDILDEKFNTLQDMYNAHASRSVRGLEQRQRKEEDSQEKLHSSGGSIIIEIGEPASMDTEDGYDEVGMDNDLNPSSTTPLQQSFPTSGDTITTTTTTTYPAASDTSSKSIELDNGLKMGGGKIDPDQLKEPKVPMSPPKIVRQSSGRNKVTPTNGNARYCKEVMAPPGRLGLVLGSTPEGPVVQAISEDSPLKDKIVAGDLVTSINKIDTRSMPSHVLTALIIGTTMTQRQLMVESLTH